MIPDRMLVAIQSAVIRRSKEIQAMPATDPERSVRLDELTTTAAHIAVHIEELYE